MFKKIALYVMAISIPAVLALNAWQADRYARLENSVEELERQQGEWLESNKRLIAGIAVLGSSDRVENVAQDELKMRKVAPESVLQVEVTKGDAK